MLTKARPLRRLVLGVAKDGRVTFNGMIVRYLEINSDPETNTEEVVWIPRGCRKKRHGLHDYAGEVKND